MKPIIHNLNPVKFVAGLVQHIASNLPHSSEEELPAGEIVFDGGLKVQAMDLWNHLGQIKWLGRSGGRSVGIKVPDMGQLFDAHQTIAKKRNQRCRDDATPFMLEFHRALLDSRHAVERMFQVFQQGTPENQSGFIAGLRKSFAIDILGVSLSEGLVTYLNTLHATGHLSNEGQQLLNAILLVRKAADDAIPIRMRFFRTYYWESQVVPPEGIRCFLPAGMWDAIVADGPPVCVDNVPRDKPTAEEGPILDLSGDEKVDRSDPTVDVDRYDFYRSLGCKEVVRPKGKLGEQGYLAYLLKTGQGQPVAFVDSNRPKNAAYVFWIDAERMAWSEHAQESKRAVRTKAGSEGHTFARRFWHTATWQERAKNWLATAILPTAAVPVTP